MRAEEERDREAVALHGGCHHVAFGFGGKRDSYKFNQPPFLHPHQKLWIIVNYARRRN